jgi:hypothetical protein
MSLSSISTRVWTWLGLALSALLLNITLITPNHPDALTLDALRMIPLELPFILLILWLLPAQARVTQLVRGAVVVWLMFLTIARLADIGTFIAFDRGFNFVVDWNLITAGLLTVWAALGGFSTVLALGALTLALTLLTAALWTATGTWAKLSAGSSLRRTVAAGLMGSLFLVVADTGYALQRWGWVAPTPGDAYSTRQTISYISQWVGAFKGLRQFNQMARQDPFAKNQQRLSKLDHRDVMIIFVESYGRSSFDNPLYASTHVNTLTQAQQTLADKGVAMRSGWLTAPMVGGQSWLTHGTLATGLWVSDQGRYRALMQSQRQTLFHYAQQAGFRTAAIMPAIRMNWPEGEFFGFDAIYDADQLGYKGLPFNWVTMPDQFALKALDRLERQPKRSQPLFAQIALTSSHAPWLPIPPVIEWANIGDGSIFNQWAISDETPEQVWRDQDRVRDQFRQAVDYSLQTVFSYVEQHADDPPLIIILGDHEPARFVSQNANKTVAMHVLGPPDLVANIQDWNWTPGLIPDPNLVPWRMDTFRDKFLSAFSADVTPSTLP